jgi:hypothetical protein
MPSCGIVRSAKDLRTVFFVAVGTKFVKPERNDSGGKVLDVPDESTEAHDLHLWDDNGGPYQAWRLIDLGRGQYQIRNRNSGLVLGIASSTPGAAVQQQAESGEAEQVWEIVVAE